MTQNSRRSLAYTERQEAQAERFQQKDHMTRMMEWQEKISSMRMNESMEDQMERFMARQQRRDEMNTTQYWQQHQQQQPYYSAPYGYPPQPPPQFPPQFAIQQQQAFSAPLPPHQASHPALLNLVYQLRHECHRRCQILVGRPAINRSKSDAPVRLGQMIKRKKL